MRTDYWHGYIQEFDLLEGSLNTYALDCVRDSTATFLMDQVIEPFGHFYRNDTMLS
jgi:hypothetical protein